MGMRIKVRFEEELMVSEEEGGGALSQCWFLVGQDVRTIAELVRDIASAFRLRRSCPDGILLYMDDFSLPLSQPISLLKDGDVLSIKKRKDPSKENADLKKLAKDPNTNASDNLNGHTQVCIGGVKLLALEEFEEESGGYQSEREDELDSMDEGIDSKNNLLSVRSAKWKLKPIADEQSEGEKQLSHEYREKNPECQKTINGTKLSWKRDSKPLDTSKKKKKRKGNELLYLNGQEEKLCDKRGSSSVDIKKKKKTADNKHSELSVEEVKTDDVRGTKPVNSSKKKKKSKGKESLDPSVEKGDDKWDMSKGAHKEKKKRKEKEASESSAEEHLENAVQRLSKKKTLDGSVQKKRKLQGKMQSSMKKIDDESSESNKEVATKKGNNICTVEISKHFVDGIEIVKEYEERRKSNHFKGKKSLSMLTKDQRKEGKENCESPASCFEGKKPPKALDKEAEVANMKSKHRDTVREEDIGGENTSKEVGMVQKPSRSSLRKKAKRRWKRELAAVALAEAEGRSIHQSEISANENKKHEMQFGSKKPEIHCPNVDNDDIEAEEERLPIVVRPGHIRFHDEGENAIKTDMHTQYDGEQSIVSNQDEKIQQSLIRDIRLEELPVLTRLPQEGDTLAYRLVELTAWMCPELSDYRVGQVVSFDTGSSKILLNSLQEYPIKLNNEQQMEDEENTFSLYNEDGSLEIDLASLVDVRIVEESCITKKINKRFEVTQRIEEDGLPKSDQVEPKCEGLLASSLADAPIIKESLGGIKSINETVHLQSPESDHTTILPQALQQVQEAFEKKRKEIMHLLGSDSAKDNALETRNKDMHAKRSFKTIRAGALGPTLALLRNQNVL